MSPSLRIQSVIEAFCAMAHVQNNPVAIYHHFVDSIHLLAFAPVNVSLYRDGHCVRQSVPPGELVMISSQYNRQDADSLLDKCDHAVSGSTITVTRLTSAKTYFRPGTLAALFKGIASRSRAASDLLDNAMRMASTSTPEKQARIPLATWGQSELRPETLAEALSKFESQLSEIADRFLSHGDLTSVLSTDPRSTSPMLPSVRVACTLKFVPRTGYSRIVGAEGDGISLPYAGYRPGEAQEGGWAVPTERTKPFAPEIEDLSLQGGFLQINLHARPRMWAVTIPVHVGGTAWLTTTLFTRRFDSWPEILRFYSYAFPSFAEQVRTAAEESFLDAVKNTIDLHGPWVRGESWSLEPLNSRLLQLSMIYPYAVVRIGEGTLDNADVTPDGRPIHVIVDDDHRPLVPELEYRPLTAKRVLDASLEVLRVYEKRWIAQTDALVAGVYKIGHQLGHTVTPLNHELEEIRELFCHYASSPKGELAEELRASISTAQQIGRKAERKALILDILATATLERTGSATFLRNGKSEWRRANALFTSLEVLNEWGKHVWVSSAAPVMFSFRDVSAFEISPWISAEDGTLCRPVDDCYSEFLDEIVLNASRSGAWADGSMLVDVEVYPDALDGGGHHSPLLVFENRPRYPDKDLTVQLDGLWHDWPTGKGAPSGGLFFLAMFAIRTGLGGVYVRRRVESGRELFAVGLCFHGMKLIE